MEYARSFWATFRNFRNSKQYNNKNRPNIYPFIDKKTIATFHAPTTPAAPSTSETSKLPLFRIMNFAKASLYLFCIKTVLSHKPA